VSGPRGHALRWSLWEGDGVAGALVDGCPPGLPLDEAGAGARILSGVFEGRTTGTPVSLQVTGGTAAALLAAGALARGIVAEVSIRAAAAGATVTCIAEGVPAGWGAPVQARLDAELAGAIGGLAGARRIEIGDGFAAARLSGSGNADPMRAGPAFLANHAGGILGGISSGQPVVARVGFDPPPERAADLVAAAFALVLADQKLLHRAQCG
jgi:chorismate synthase